MLTPGFAIKDITNGLYSNSVGNSTLSPSV
jgi:hypothetical protein